MGSKKVNTEKNKKKKYKSKKEEGGKNAASASNNYNQNNNNDGGKMITDSRFASVHSDPRFQNVPRQKSKVAIDSRFDRMFSDKSFTSSSAPFDKRGKPKKIKSENPLRHYYHFEEEYAKEEEKCKGTESDANDEYVEEEIEKGQKLEKLRGKSLDSGLSDESEHSGSEDDIVNGDSEYSTDTGDEDDGEDVSVEEDEDEGNDEDESAVESVPVIDKETHRLAVVNMDWRHVRAVDLYVMLTSFLTNGGQILSVSVYPSEFGLKRMEEEAVHGPIGLFDDDKEQADGDGDDDDDEIDAEKLRAYEQSKLRYYYAVVDCDSIATADYLYNACDGVEFERSSNKLDLRFIPDSMEFKHPPRDVATEAPSTYEGLDFITRELQHSKVNLTWDEDEPHRAKTLKRKFNADQLAELEFKEFLVSDESESDDDENGEATEVQPNKKHKKRDMYRALLESGDGSDDDGEEGDQDMEVTFNTGLEDISKRILEKKDKKSETVWEAYLRKKSEKKKTRKNRSKDSSDDESSYNSEEVKEEPDDFFVEEPSAKSLKETRVKSDRKEKHNEMDREAEASRAELELLFADDKGENTNHKGYNLKPKKAKGKKGKQVPDENKIPTADYDDPRFSALFSSHLFSLDPTDPQFKRSAAYARQLAQKQEKGGREDLVEKEHKKLHTKSQSPSDELQMDKNENLKPDVLCLKNEKHEISSLVKSIKMKSKQIQLPSDGKILKKDEKPLLSDIAEHEGKDELSNLVRSIKKKTKVLKR